MNRRVFSAVSCLFVLSLVFLSGDNRRLAATAQDFDMCITDDGGAASMRFSSTSGAYIFCAAGKTLSGTGTVSNSGGSISLQHSAADRRVMARVSTSAKAGSASVQSPVGKTIGTIADSNTADSDCRCR
jgi:hypothetical protein